jgi:hypothetical protein
LLSFALTVNVAGPPASETAATVTSPGVVTTGGGVVSTSVGMRSVQSPFGHSFTSKQPTYPSPAKFFGQAPHVRDPAVFVHDASLWQPPFPLAHSLTSEQPVAGVPKKPS